MSRPAWRTSSADLYLEVGNKKVFACSVWWLGWCRAGKTEEQAIETLAAYAGRYAPVPKAAGLEFEPPGDFNVIERVQGNATTDFGAPGIPSEHDRKKLTPARARDAVALLEAVWKTFDKVVAKAPAELRKGPRGGGRDRDKMVQHVLGAETAYARGMGIKMPEPDVGDRKAIAALRSAISEGIVTAPESGPKAWPVHYAARRVAWHVLDHAWEIEDRSD